jgi:hypothetical protein
MAGQYVDNVTRLNPVPQASSSTLLANGATFSSPWVSTGNYGVICGTVYADKAGQLQVFQSFDQSHGDAEYVYNYPAGTLPGFSVEVVAPYFMVSFLNNSGGNHTVFRLNTGLRRS